MTDEGMRNTEEIRETDALMSRWWIEKSEEVGTHAKEVIDTKD